MKIRLQLVLNVSTHYFPDFHKILLKPPAPSSPFSVLLILKNIFLFVLQIPFKMNVKLSACDHDNFSNF